MRPISRPASARDGFTLLELSIVIGIIGLLVGGVLATQNYLRTAEMSTSINEGKLHLNAFDQFVTKYGAVPGDMATASAVWSTAHNGDGNGFIFQGAYAGGGADNPSEYFQVWEHLALAGFIQGTYSGVGTLTTAYPTGYESSGTTPNIPVSSYRSGSNVGAFLFSHPSSSTPYGGDSLMFTGYYGHYLQLGGWRGATHAVPLNNNLFSAREAFALDTKFDNGKPGLGWMRTPKNSYRPNCATTDDPTTAEYQATETGPQCWFYMTTR